MAVDEATVRRIARLARIKVNDAEAKGLVGELNGILDWVKQLDEVKTDGVAPMTSVWRTCAPPQQSHGNSIHYFLGFLRRARRWLAEFHWELSLLVEAGAVCLCRCQAQYSGEVRALQVDQDELNPQDEAEPQPMQRQLICSEIWNSMPI